MGRRVFLVAAALLAASPACGTDGGTAAPCTFTVSKNAVSAKIPTVGEVEWSLAGRPPSSAKIVWTRQDPAGSTLNRGGEAPVDLTKPNYRTLLLGLKQVSAYAFHIEAVRGGQTCVSPDYALPFTGSLTPSPDVSVAVSEAAAREPGFIVTSSGQSVPTSAFILDADGDVVWAADAPDSTGRALMDYAGENMWMVALNPINEGGEMRYVSMDGEQAQQNIAGLENAHHDLTVMPGGKVAALVWSTPGNDPPSDLVIRSPDGTLNTAFTIGSNLYAADSGLYHADAVHYLPFDDSFTISDRNPNLVVKVSATGTLDWQLGGTCAGAPAGDRCSAQGWLVNHGHHLLADGTFLLFNNGQNDNGDVNHIIQFKLNDTRASFTAALVEDYTGTGSGNNLGDVQRLPGGNTLVTYSIEGKIVELDPDWNEVQTFSVRVGYASWRPSLYGPPPRA